MFYCYSSNSSSGLCLLIIITVLCLHVIICLCHVTINFYFDSFHGFWMKFQCFVSGYDHGCSVFVHDNQSLSLGHTCTGTLLKTKPAFTFIFRIIFLVQKLQNNSGYASRKSAMKHLLIPPYLKTPHWSR